MTRVELRYGAATDVGLVRAANEDAYLAQPPVFVVADGMGGHDGGDVASGIVVEEFARIGDDRLDTVAAARCVIDALVASQKRIGEFSAEHRAQGSPQWYSGTTVVVALLVAEGADAAWLVVNLGDSRAYRLSGEELSQVTVDHSVVQELIDAGQLDPEDAPLHPDRHVVTRALGGPEEVAPDFFLVPLGGAERLLLCSDGVNGMLDDERIGAILREAPDPGVAADRLVAAAIEVGGRDNATAVVVDVVGWAP